MPADRTRASIRQAAHPVVHSPLTWTAPVEPHQSIAFATNVTPITYNEPPALVEYNAPEAILFPPPAECSSGRRPAHSKKKPENHIPRPPNAFILFRSSFIKSQHVSTEVETNHSTLSKIIGLTWQNLPNEERQVWHAKAKAALEDHKRRFPSYAFRPAHARGKGGTEKRKVREVGPKDVKRCEKIAELLVEGKKGEELDAAIQEFDRTHVPEVVTRFEAPLTARMYRRSSSAPVPDAEEKKAFLQPSSSPRSQRIRAASTQPTRNTTPSPPSPELSVPVELCPENFYEASLTSGFTQPTEYSFTQKPEHSFNLNSFFFEQAGSPYDPPTPASVDNGLDMYHQQNVSQRHPAPLSINTSFSQDWTTPNSPFSSSPSTPQLYSQQPSPSTCHTPLADMEDTFPMSDFNLESFDQPTSFNSQPLDMNHSAFLSADFDVLSKESTFGALDQSKPQLAGQDPYFSAFMQSLQASYMI